jgi:hypothetical protein
MTPEEIWQRERLALIKHKTKQRYSCLPDFQLNQKSFKPDENRKEKLWKEHYENEAWYFHGNPLNRAYYLAKEIVTSFQIVFLS